MPIYEYQCGCGFKLEIYQKIGSDAPPCPECGKKMVKKISLQGITIIKGKGGYPVRSKGYKEGYSKEYLKDNPPAQEFS